MISIPEGEHVRAQQSQSIYPLGIEATFLSTVDDKMMLIISNFAHVVFKGADVVFNSVSSLVTLFIMNAC